MQGDERVGPSDLSRRPRQENQPEWYVDPSDIERLDEHPQPSSGVMQGGPAASEDGGRPRRGAVSDESLFQEVRERLAADPGVDASDIGLSVAGAAVTLSGCVNSQWEKLRAEALVAVPGVRDVRSELRVRNEARDAR